MIISPTPFHKIEKASFLDSKSLFVSDDVVNHKAGPKSRVDISTKACRVH
jgi:hypothetical protein